MSDDTPKTYEAFDKGLKDLNDVLERDIEEALHTFTERVEATLADLRKGFDGRTE